MTHPLIQLLEALSRSQGTPAQGVSGPRNGTKAAASPPRRRRGSSTRRKRSGAVDPVHAEPTPFEQGRLLARVFEESQRINWALFRAYVQPHLTAQMALLRHAYGLPAPNSNGHGKDQQDENELFEMLTRLQLWVLQNPLAAQAVFASLVAEGRRFATTKAGARWARALAESDLVRKGRLVWEATTLNLLEEREGAILPTTYLEVLRRAVMTRNFESLLARLRQGIAQEET
jgi:hypothetical protein